MVSLERATQILFFVILLIWLVQGIIFLGWFLYNMNKNSQQQTEIITYKPQNHVPYNEIVFNKEQIPNNYQQLNNYQQYPLEYQQNYIPIY